MASFGRGRFNGLRVDGLAREKVGRRGRRGAAGRKENKNPPVDLLSTGGISAIRAAGLAVARAPAN